MSGILVRILIAVIVVIALYVILPPLFAVLAFPQSAAVITILKVIIAALALLYIIGGANVRGWFN